MAEFRKIHEFTDRGMELYRYILSGEVPEASMDLRDPAMARAVSGSRPFLVKDFPTAKHMAVDVIRALGSVDPSAEAGNLGLWSWLTFVLRDQLFNRDGDGRLKVGEIHRWYPSDPNDWHKGQRHMVRMPVLVEMQFIDDANHLLCHRPSVRSEVFEQLTSQKDMFVKVFQRAACSLYFDHSSGSLKRGSGGKAGGSARRLAKVRQQLDVTWDLDELSSQEILDLLPSEFDRFKNVG